jgi:hypothetical protein
MIFNMAEPISNTNRMTIRNVRKPLRLGGGGGEYIGGGNMGGSGG